MTQYLRGLDRSYGKTVKSIDELAALVGKKRPGDMVPIEILRDDKKIEKRIILARRLAGAQSTGIRGSSQKGTQTFTRPSNCIERLGERV